LDKIRVLIADDSALLRQQLTQLLEQDGRFELAGIARDGEEAVHKAVQLQPDVITMDIQMPRMDGLTSLQYIMEMAPCPVIILSTFSKKGAVVTFEAMELGAFDFVPKPDHMAGERLETVFNELAQRMVEATHSRKYKRMKAAKMGPQMSPDGSGSETDYTKIVIIGVSTGGPKTVMDILPHLPADLPAPVLLIQHMPPLFTASFAERLDRSVPMQVVEASNRMILKPGTIYVAPGGQHLYVERMIGTSMLRLAVRPQPVDAVYKPSIDVTMFSVLRHVPAERLVGVLLTGIGADGAEGMAAIREGGGTTIAEAEETAIVYGMPRAALERGAASMVLPSYLIGQSIVKEVRDVWSKNSFASIAKPGI
jgi:two-component system, chemotaxis family, protein-glutamate methylesterase/glutaminase